MKTSKRLTAFLLCLAFLLILFYGLENRGQVNLLKGQLNDLKGKFEAQTKAYVKMELHVAKEGQNHKETVESLKQQIAELQRVQQKLRDRTDFLDRGGERPTKMTMKATAYDLSYQSCGKLPDHPEYGITASGERVREWNTIAAGPELPFGTKVYIPYFREMPNNGMFVVKDRGRAITKGRIDIYMASYGEAMKFGKKDLIVWVIK